MKKNPTSSIQPSECKLCLEEKPLIKSHVISNFLIKLLYGEKPQYSELSTIPGDQKKKGQGGIVEKLLCSSCEHKRAVWEQYARKFFLGGLKEMSAEMIKPNIYKVTGLNYSKLKLFFLSTVWMASISTDPKLTLINLGPHEERIREILQNEKPGPHYIYPIFISGMADDWAKGMLHWDTLRIDGHNCYRFVMGGTIWVLVVSSHKLPQEMLMLSLQENGDVLYYAKPAKEIEFIVQASMGFQVNKMLNDA